MKGKKPKKMDNHNHGVGCKKLKNDLEFFVFISKKNVSNNATAIKQSVASIFSSSCSSSYDDV